LDSTQTFQVRNSDLKGDQTVVQLISLKVFLQSFRLNLKISSHLFTTSYGFNTANIHRAHRVHLSLIITYLKVIQIQISINYGFSHQ